MIRLKSKGLNEIITTILIMLVMVIVVGIIITGVNSQISKGKEKTNYDNSIKVRDLLYSEIMQIYNSPIESTKEVTFSLSNLSIDINSDNETIEICSVGKNLNFFADGKRLEEDNNKYVYRNMQQLCSGIVFENIDLIRNISFSNKEQARLIFKKITENKISVSVDNETNQEWYTSKNSYIYDETSGEWKYRKKIVIAGENILGTLTNIPVKITLTDEDLKNYANPAASDLIFTLGDGVTKIKKEILDYNSGTGELSALLKIPSFDIGTDINIYTYDEKTRKKITIDHTKVDGDLNDFPVLLSIKDQNLVDIAKEDGSDIYFTANDGTTRLKREIESFTDISLFRKKITIDHTKVDASLTDFPVLISLTDDDLANYAANVDGNDIYFTTSNGYTRLKREIEDYNSATGTLVAWVKIPSLSSTTDTDIYVHFGNSEESNTNDTDVWDSTFVGVWHLKETGSNPEVFDSTINNNNSVSNLADPTVNGKINNAMTFTSANSDIITIADSDSLDVNYLTLSVWINLSTWATYPAIIAKGYWDGGGEAYSLHIRDNYTIWTDINNSGSRIYYNPATKAITLGNWHYVTTTVSPDTIRTFIDGIESGTGKTGTYDISTTDHNLIIGRLPNFGFINGIIDEVRISNTARSESWIKTEYNNQSSPSTFYSVGDLEDVTINLVAWVKIPNLSSTTDTDIYMYFGDENENNTNDTDVWDENFVGVWHNNDYNSSYVKESKTGLASASKKGSNEPSQINGQIGYAQYCDGVDDYIDTKIATVSYPKSTISFWSNFKNQKGPSPGTAILGSVYWTNNNFVITQQHGTTLYSVLFIVGNSKYAGYYNSYSEINKWYYYSFTYDSDQNTWANALKLYVNGTAKNISPSTGDTEPVEVSGANSLKLCSKFFKGFLDEVRISNTLRSESWVKTEYNNQSSPETFCSVGEMTDANILTDTATMASNANTGIYVYFGNPVANILDDNIEDGNVVSVSLGVLEKS